MGLQEDSDAMEAELDRGEIIARSTQEELIGESLLSAEYSTANSDAKSKGKSGADFLHESTILSRPITPQQLRQSMMFQSQQRQPPSSASRTNQSMVIRDNKMSQSTLNPIVNRSNSATVKSVNPKALRQSTAADLPFSKLHQTSRQTSLGTNTFEFTPPAAAAAGNKALSNKLSTAKTGSKSNVESASKKVNILTLDHSIDPQEPHLVDASLFINNRPSSSGSKKNAKISYSSTNYASKVYDLEDDEEEEEEDSMSKDEFDVEEVEEEVEDDDEDAGSTTKSYFKSQSVEKPVSAASRNPVAFETRSKLPRTPVQSVAGAFVQESATIVTPTTSYMPFFSVNEPRPSSANSKNSSKDSTTLFSTNPVESVGTKAKKFGKF